jgi:hypothetical protein
MLRALMMAYGMPKEEIIRLILERRRVDEADKDERRQEAA